MNLLKVYRANLLGLIFATLSIAGCLKGGPPTEKDIKDNLDSKISVTEIHSIKDAEGTGLCHYSAFFQGTKGYEVLMSYNHNLGACKLGMPFYGCGIQSYKKVVCFQKLEKNWSYSIPP